MNETTITQDTEAPETALLVREFQAEFTPGDGRTVDVRIVPYGVAADVSDDRGKTFYREEWAAGAFDDQLVAGHRLKVLLNFEHRGGIGDIVGKGVALRSMPDGLHGTFRMASTQDGDKALELINDGILDSVSLEAVPKKSVRTAAGVVRRVKAHLHNVAICRQGAFPDARVLAVRESHHVIDELPAELVAHDLDPDTVALCERLGIQIPDRYQAHPDEPDTPADADTSEDGTRQTDNDNNPEVESP
jgi:Escherichia/Staphylococcus phage prohead protease